MHVSLSVLKPPPSPAVIFTLGVDRQLSLKPDGTKFSHAHAHAHHPSAETHICAFLGFSKSRRCADGGRGSNSRCVSRCIINRTVWHLKVPPGHGVLSISQAPISLWITWARPCPNSRLPRGHLSHYTAQAKTRAEAAGDAAQGRRLPNEAELLLRADGAPDKEHALHKDAAFRGVPPVADGRTGCDAAGLMAAINWFLHGYSVPICSLNGICWRNLIDR